MKNNKELEMKYYDKNGKEIKVGMKLKHNDGDIEIVYPCITPEGERGLGFNASNENHPNFYEYSREIYPLYQFNLNDWEIITESNNEEDR